MCPRKSSDRSFWLDSSFKKVQNANRFLFRLLCCCGLGRRCFYRSSDYFADKIETTCCCLHDIYSPYSQNSEELEDEYKPLYTDADVHALGSLKDLHLDVVWFAPGSTIRIILLEQEVSFYHFSLLSERIRSRNYPQGKEISNQYSLCKCFNIRRKTPKIRDRMVFSTFAERLIFRLREAERIHPISVLAFTMQPTMTPEFLRKTLEKDFLEAKLSVDFLSVQGQECEDLSIFWELMKFKHLAVSGTTPLLLNQKIISCGFLSLHVPLINPEALEQFNGFGLVVQDTIFNVSRIIEEVEKWMTDTTSKLQLITIIFLSKEAYEQASSKLSKYSSTGTYLQFKPRYGREFSFIPLEDANHKGAAIFKKDNLISFATGNWTEWASTLSTMHRDFGVLHVPRS